MRLRLTEFGQRLCDCRHKGRNLRATINLAISCAISLGGWTYPASCLINYDIKCVSNTIFARKSVRFSHQLDKFRDSSRDIWSENIDVEFESLKFISNGIWESNIYWLTSAHSLTAVAAVNRTTVSEPGPRSLKRCTSISQRAGILGDAQDWDTHWPIIQAIRLLMIRKL